MKLMVHQKWMVSSDDQLKVHRADENGNSIAGIPVNISQD